MKLGRLVSFILTLGLVPVFPLHANASDTEYIDDLDATTYYAEMDQGRGSFGRYTNIMQKYPNKDPERIARIDGRVNDYYVSPDKRYVGVRQQKKLRSIDTYNGSVDDILESKNKIWGMTYSTDGSGLIAAEKGRNKDYYLHYYDQINHRDNVIYTGQSNSSFYPYAWRPDNIVIFIEVRMGRENVWNYDVNKNNFYQTNYTNPNWISYDGRYVALADASGSRRNSSTHRVYDYNQRYRYSDPFRDRLVMYDPATGRSYGYVGGNGFNNSIIGYYPDRNEILYQSYKNKNKRDYYSYSINGNRLGAVSQPYDYMNRWNDNSFIGTDINRNDGYYNLTTGDSIVLRAKNPIQIIICFSEN